MQSCGSSVVLDSLQDRPVILQLNLCSGRGAIGPFADDTACDLARLRVAPQSQSELSILKSRMAVEDVRLSIATAEVG